MADTDMKDTVSEDTSGNSSDSNASDSEAEQVETLVAGRQKRATAANRYDRERLIQEAEEEAINDQDEVTLLFADDEEEEDEEFEGSDEDDADVELDSSSDDDDQGPNAQADDLEGENQLQREAKAERTRKRKARLELTTAAGLQKRVRIDPRLPGRDPAIPKPSKKKERQFVLLDAEGRTRASMRTTTVANKEETQARLIEDEKLRVKLKARKEKKERERARDQPPQLTQEDRLAEAGRIERRNLKSLSRWETMEKKRTEEQAAKLAALKNRKLEGPVVTWWSGVAKWVGPKLDQVGLKDPGLDGGSEAKKRGRKSNAYHEQLAAAKQKEAELTLLGAPGEQKELSPMGTSLVETSTPVPLENGNNPTETAIEAMPGSPLATPAPHVTFTTPQGPDTFLLHGIHEYASMPAEAQVGSSSGTPNLVPDQPPVEVPMEADPPISIHPPLLLPIMSHPDQQMPVPSVPLEPPKIENATRNLVVLADFEDLAARDRGDYAVFYNTRKSTKPSKHLAELCPITGLPARYRDPSTGVAYANSYAYRKLQELKKHEHMWSSMLGCYVGRAGVVARGVPEGFLGS